MKQVFLVLMMMCCAFVDAQIMLSGIVRNATDKTAVPNCYIVLKGSDGTLVQARTNPSGEYQLKLHHNTKYDVYAATDITIKTPTAKFGFLASDDHGIFDITDSLIKNYYKDFELTPIIHCETLPRIMFKLNSTEMVTDYSAAIFYSDTSSYSVETEIKYLGKILKDNPTIVMELSAHCSSNEKCVKQLSLQRAEKVKEELVKLGINSKRLVCRGYGLEKLKVQNSVIKKAKTKEEKEALHAVNRRCVFKIINWEFDDGTSKKTETPTYKPPIQKEGEQENLLPVNPDKKEN